MESAYLRHAPRGTVFHWTSARPQSKGPSLSAASSWSTSWVRLPAPGFGCRLCGQAERQRTQDGSDQLYPC